MVGLLVEGDMVDFCKKVKGLRTSLRLNAHLQLFKRARGRSNFQGSSTDRYRQYMSLIPFSDILYFLSRKSKEGRRSVERKANECGVPFRYIYLDRWRNLKAGSRPVHWQIDFCGIPFRDMVTIIRNIKQVIKQVKYFNNCPGKLFSCSE